MRKTEAAIAKVLKEFPWDNYGTERPPFDEDDLLEDLTLEIDHALFGHNDSPGYNEERPVIHGDVDETFDRMKANTDGNKTKKKSPPSKKPPWWRQWF